MSNMSYCQFENTYPDLKDCYEDMDRDDLSDSEKKYRGYLIRLCKQIVDDYGNETGEINLYAILSMCALSLLAWAGLYVAYSWAESSLRAALAVLP